MEFQVTNKEESSCSSSPPQSTIATGIDNNESFYQLKWIPWDEDFIPVVCQNKNGPCPLIALSNVLVLSQRLKISAGQTMISSTDLMDLLGSCLLEGSRSYSYEGENAANYQQNMQDAFAVFPKLQTGLDVNVNFNSVTAFEFTSESGIFDLFQVPLYHGWLADPQDFPAFDIISKLSYNQLVEMIIRNKNSTDSEKHVYALIGEEFLAKSSSQLTHHGLCELNRVVKEGDMCVFFRNNHFNTLFKHKGELLLLVTDSGFVNELDHVWQVVSDIDGSGDFLDAQFRLSAHSMTQQTRDKPSFEVIDHHPLNQDCIQPFSDQQPVPLEDPTLDITMSDHQFPDLTPTLLQAPKPPCQEPSCRIL